MNSFTFNGLKVGFKASFSKKITDKDMRIFSEISGDKNPLHLDDAYAKSMGYDKCVAFGMLGSVLHSTLAGMYLPGKYSLLVKETSKFLSPLFVGDELTITGEVKDKKEFGNLLFIETKILNQDNKEVMRGEIIVKVLK